MYCQKYVVMKIIKEYRTTCLSCGTIKHFPYVDFDERMKEEKNESLGSKTAKGIGTGVLVTSTTLACPVFGCCFAGDAINNKIRSTSLSKMNKEERIKDYCKAIICSKCLSRGIKIEVIEHEIE